MEKNRGIALGKEETRRRETTFWAGEWERRRIPTPLVVLQWKVEWVSSLVFRGLCRM